MQGNCSRIVNPYKVSKKIKIIIIIISKKIIK